MKVQRPAAGPRLLSIIAAAALVAAACNAAGASAGSAAPTAVAPSAPPSAAAGGTPAESYEVAVAQDATLGALLVGADGRTLYRFTKDADGRSACSGQCAASWPPFVLEDGATAVAGPGVTGALATIRRDDGSTQVTYDGAPLYYFAGDAKAGDVNGQGLNDAWFVVPPAGTTGSGAVGSPGGSGTGSDAGTTASNVVVSGFAFAPASVTVKAGTTVTWVNDDSVSHTVTADDGSFASPNLATGATFAQRFDAAGTYAYHCAIHPRMVGTVVVTP